MGRRDTTFDLVVNASFTMAGYPKQMISRLFLCCRMMVCAAAVLLAFGLGVGNAAYAQTGDVDWADAGIPSQGSLPSGTTATGSDGTVATITWSTQTQGAGSFDPAFSPTFVSYFNGTIGGAASPLLVSFDNSSFDPGDKITVTITLDQSVGNLNFSLGDIDIGSFSDAVEVYYDDDASGGFTNAATNTAFWTAGPSVARTNDATVNGWRGVAGSATAATDGNINFDFGSQQVQRIQIVYFSYTGTGDPTAQFLGISDFAYSGPSADLSLTKIAVGSPPVQNGTATWRLTATNSSTSALTANGVVVEDTFPAGFAFSSASGDGSFDSANGQWTVGTLAPGESAILTITGTVSSAAGTTVTNTAEIIASSEPDSDSTPNNGVTTEDDFASSSITVQNGRAPGVPPVLSCPAGFSVFDWDNIDNWTPGTTDNTYDFDGLGDVRFLLNNDGVYVTSAAFGGESPNTSPVFSGGLPTTEAALNMLANQSNQTNGVEVIVTLPRVLTGVQFTIFDVDFGANQFADRVEVVGVNGGPEFGATLTNGNSNFILGGNVAIGDAGSGSDQALGNVVVTFTQPVETIIIRYANHTTAPVDPGQQAIGIHDITACTPTTTLSVTKIGTLVGGATTKALPGALIDYVITVSNTGLEAADADKVTVWDDGPDNAKMCLISRSGGPVIYNDPGNNTGLNYDYGGTGSIIGDLALDTDDLEFSENDGATFDYEPQPDDDGCDTNITDFRVRPGGAFQASSNFTIMIRYKIE